MTIHITNTDCTIYKEQGGVTNHLKIKKSNSQKLLYYYQQL